MKTLAFASAKGGTGKTTTSVHVAVGLARRGKKVLFIDLDPQANATRWLLRERPEVGGAELALSGRKPELWASAIGEREEWVESQKKRKTSEVRRLAVIPSTEALQSTEYALANRFDAIFNLRDLLRGELSGFEYAVIDCPPTCGTGTVAALCAASHVFVPVPTAFLGLTGLADLEDNLARLRKPFRISAQIAGLLLFSVDSRVSLAEAMRKLLRETKPGLLMKAEVRVSTAAAKLPEQHRTAWEPGADARGLRDYEKVLDEVLARVGGKGVK